MVEPISGVGGGMVVEERGTWSRAPTSRCWHSMSYRRPITPEMAHYAAIRAAASWLVGYVLDGNQHTFVVQLYRMHPICEVECDLSCRDMLRARRKARQSQPTRYLALES
ncbi:hypothetical protein MJO28_006251 [Puccinia striiformis f. sp. tritici]|uniref:Uncharacterized protein n=1 Tax=Puccinia striiformis f. sp. tritici TaxID=168172 RepID=A0ACC0EHP3_9BASI|nr:hypothetical protein MJO28_006251 [Puccinia striiformis f. sp. tritici]